MDTNESYSDEVLYEQGKSAASTLWKRWKNRPVVEDPQHPAFARGALDEIVRRLEGTDDVYKEMLESSEAAAEQLTKADRTILEIIQNADDLEASKLRMAVRRSGKGEFLAVHNGKKIEVAHVIAMTLAFLSMKREDAKAKGRFGIGLKTLNQIGAKLSVHCPPYHFSIEKGSLQAIDAPPSIKGLYDSSGSDTLLVVALDGEYTPDDVIEWVKRLDASHMVFLDHMRSMSLIDPRSGKPEWSAELSKEDRPNFQVEMKPGTPILAACTSLFEPGDKGRRWTRYSLEYPVPEAYKRAHKATGKFTPLSIAISESSEPGWLSAGLPLDFANTLPISLNAQFDPDLSRRGVRQLKWNEWLFNRLAALTAGVVIHRFEHDPKTGWQAIPLREENAVDEDWTESQIEELIAKVQEHVKGKLRLAIERESVGLSDISFPAAEVARLLSEVDQATLQPEFTALPRDQKDKAGRWRNVLEELGEGYRFSVRDALQLLDLDETEFGARTEKWFLDLADEALRAEQEFTLSSKRSVLGADGKRYRPTGEILLVRELVEGSLAQRLGLEVQLASCYFSTRTTDRVSAWLDRYCVTDISEGGTRVLQALSRRSEQDPLFLDDKALIDLRSALHETDEIHRISLSAAIGKRIVVDGYEFRKGKKLNRRIAPSSAYLPTPIAKDTLGWAAAAKSTEGLLWIDARYASIMRKGSGGNLSSKKFFSLLGAKSGPRLEKASEERRTPIGPVRPAAQADAIQAISRPRRPTHLTDDYVSPDLDRVIASISKQKVDAKRRGRAQALIVTLEREWDDYLSDKSEVSAEYSHYIWRSAGSIPATWLARAASEKWLSTKSKRKVAPRETAIETVTTRLTRGNSPSKFVHELREVDSSSPLVAALEIQGTPPASELLAELAALKDKYGDDVRPKDVTPLYAALAALIPRERPHSIGDLPTSELQTSFENKALLLTGKGWLPPSQVFRGKPIFGERRAFVSDVQALRPLWQLLQISEPTIGACIEVMGELADQKTVPTADSKGMIVDVLRRLAETQAGAKGQELKKLSALPLWTSKGWCLDRPVYAVSSDNLESSLGEKLPIWAPFCSLQSLDKLPDILGVVKIVESDFSLTADTDVSDADDFTERCFRSVVSRMKSTLAQESQSLWDSIDWERLQECKLYSSKELLTYITISGRKIAVLRDVHVEQKLHVYFEEAANLGSPEAGRYILNRFATRELPAMIDFAWAYAWQQAEAGDDLFDKLELAADVDGGIDPLQQLEKRGKKAKGARLFSGRTGTDAKKGGKRKLPPAPKPRQLKNFEGASIADVALFENQRPSKTAKSKKRRLIANPKSKSPPQNSQGGTLGVKEWTEKERERRGFELLAAALKEIDDLDLEDYSALHQIGADSIDNLSRYFELKTFSGDATDEVRFEHSEFQRAIEAEKDYFLAVVSGLEEGKDTEIRIFADPLRTLQLKRVPQIRLGGIRSGGKSVLRLKIDTPSGAKPK